MFRTVLATVAIAMVFTSINVSAQQRGRGGQDGRGGRSGFDRAQMMDRFMDRYKDALEFSDDEWTAVKPMVEKIMSSRMRSSSIFGRSFGGRGGDGNRGDRGGRSRSGDDDNSEQNALEKALDSDASSAEIKEKLAAYRDARKKQAAALKKAQDDFRAILTIKQEARATLMGLIE